MKKMHRNIGIGVAAFHCPLCFCFPCLSTWTVSGRKSGFEELSNALGRKVEVGDFFWVNPPARLGDSRSLTFAG